MPQNHPLSSDAGNTFEDLSGVNATVFSNPYDALVDACNDDPKEIQSRYFTHRVTRNAKQKESLLDPDFKGLNLDAILQRLEDPSIEPGFVDPRNSLVFWARPPLHIRELVSQIQLRLRKLAPSLWLMPIPNLHMTALEITHSVTAPAISQLITQLQSLIPTMTDLPFHHRPRLIKPFLSYDSSAMALSFLPAAGEGLSLLTGQQPSRFHPRQPSDDIYTYHHLRRDLYAMAHSAGIAIESRYVVPSAHITIGRFVTQADHDSREKMERWVAEIEAINRWLESEYWPQAEASANGEVGKEFLEGGEWVVGDGKGLDLRKGVLWYGGGETVRLGKEF